MSHDKIYRWHDAALHLDGATSPTLGPIAVADSWLVDDGATLALTLHRERFLTAVRAVHGVGSSDTGSTDSGSADSGSAAASDATTFFDAARELIPHTGAQFPRVELRVDGAQHTLVLRVRPAPERSRSVVVASIAGHDPRTQPLVKGPDLERMADARADAAERGAGEAVVLTDEGYVVEGAYSALLWWRGNILCGPPATFDRIDSVTARSVLGLATALGVETYEEAVTPAELEGTELWSLSALHGIRIVTRWVDGPALAELPGRLSTWRARLGALRQPL